MHSDTATESTWITAALSASAEREATWIAAIQEHHAERVANERKALEEQLRRCGIPLERATLTRDDDKGGGWIATVDGYQFMRHGYALTRLVRCPQCERTVMNGHDVQSPGADVGAMLRDDTPSYHHCPGRPVGPEDYDEDGELIDRTPRPSPPPPPPSAPSTGERIAAALERMVPLLDSIASAASYREFGAYGSPLPTPSVDEPLSVSLDDADLPPCEGCGQRGMCYCDGPPDADLEQRFDSADDEDTVPDVSRDER